jgi:predicted ester cyclase
MTSPSSSESRVEENKATLRRMLERLSAGDVDGFVSALAPGYVRHCQAMPPELQEIRGPAAMRDWLLANQATFPDYREDLDTLVGEGDFVAWRSVGRGTQSRPMGPFPATGQRMAIVIIGMHRFEHGRVVETWTSWDNLAALTQLGLFPVSSPSSAGGDPST